MEQITELLNERSWGPSEAQGLVYSSDCTDGLQVKLFAKIHKVGTSGFRLLGMQGHPSIPAELPFQL